MTKDIKEISDKDNRYIRALELVAQNEGMEQFSPSSVKIFESQVLGDDIIDMDAFYRDYLRCLEEIKADLGEDVHILINISSGTPAMKAALYILKSVVGISGTDLYQVKDPDPEGKKGKTSKTYDVEELFSRNSDNQQEKIIRIRQAKAENIKVLRAGSIVRKLIDMYDYSGALEAYEEIVPKRLQKREIKTLLKFADERKHLNISNNREYQEYFSKLPNTKDFKGYERYECKSAEYLLRVGLYIDSYEYSDMVRFLTPLNTEILHKLFGVLTKISFSNIWDASSDRFVTNLGSEFWKYPSIQSRWPRYGDKLVSPKLIMDILKDMGVVNDKQLLGDLDMIVGIEKLRNQVAHRMISLSKENVKVIADPQAIYEMEKRMLSRTGVTISSEWDSYDKMNMSIEEALKQ
ncbi:MAG: hypothetical protein J5379_00545 [Clostridiales bacterium]|nr:hypothetical protein [Clostridiales bacterium]